MSLFFKTIKCQWNFHTNTFWIFNLNASKHFSEFTFAEATLNSCFQRKRYSWKYTAILRENIHAKVWFQKSCKATLLNITLWHGCSPVNLLHNFKAAVPTNMYGGLLLHLYFYFSALPINLSINLLTTNVSWHHLETSQLL